MLDTWIRDVRHGARSLARKPGFSVVVVLTLTLGIGATSALFTLVHAIVIAPLPFDGSDRPVAVQHAAPDRGLADVGQCAASLVLSLDGIRQSAFQLGGSIVEAIPT